MRGLRSEHTTSFSPKGAQMNMQKRAGAMRLVAATVATFALFGSMLTMPGSALADGSVNWTGQGTTGGVLNTEICTNLDGTATGPYLLWVFTGGKNVTSATISINGGAEGGAMTQKGLGAFQFYSDYHDPSTVSASVTYVGTSTNPQLVISHGCPPQEQILYWCSPGFWWQNYGELALTIYDPTPYFGVDIPGYEGVYTIGDAVLGGPTAVGGGEAFNAAANYLAAIFFDPAGTQPANPEDEHCPLNAHGEWIG
jgi:hypothetical protein